MSVERTVQLHACAQPHSLAFKTREEECAQYVRETNWSFHAYSGGCIVPNARVPEENSSSHVSAEEFTCVVMKNVCKKCAFEEYAKKCNLPIGKIEVIHLERRGRQRPLTCLFGTRVERVE